jgi:hypothetical protein
VFESLHPTPPIEMTLVRLRNRKHVIGQTVRVNPSATTPAASNLRLADLLPMAVIMGDLHWCEPSSLRWLGGVVAQSGPRVVFGACHFTRRGSK